MQQLVKEFTKGLWTELPPFRLVLGLCPTLAVTKTADNGLGMGLAVIFVLVLSNMLISLVRDHHPQKSPHRLLHRHFRVARGCRGTAHAGLRPTRCTSSSAFSCRSSW